MKLGDKIKPNSVVEIALVDDTIIKLNSPTATHELEIIDDGVQQLQLVTTVSAGRRKGDMARIIVPYHAIKTVSIVGE